MGLSDDVNGAGGKRGGRTLGVPFGRADQNRRRNARHDAFDDLDRGHAGELEIEHDRRRAQAFDQGEGVAAGPGFADDQQARIGAQDRPQEPPFDPRIVDQHDGRDVLLMRERVRAASRASQRRARTASRQPQARTR